jgi:tetratricopeptide (TPR) repeat protein
MFLEKRVYQGSSGRVYPNQMTDRVSDDRVDQAWQAVHLENEYVRLMILPEIGGRIHVGQDLTNGYDFFYRQRVIKPALVGLLGPWISGGVEFNWPQHHRPSTFMPVDWTIEEEPDGARTVWLSEHEPMNRMKGMVGIRLRPGSSLVEARVRLSNRTPHVQTFLWWANVAVAVHDRYQSFFPPDVTHVADHARRATSEFPVARGRYYGIDYGARDPADADLSWYANIPVPTSYMAMGSEADFFGGYDHAAGAGLVHVADHRIAPGKKQWTWGNAGFGQAWDRNLTDEGGPYIELMAGVYTDNQPDFSFLAPYETRTFEQAWYPIRGIGPAIAANRLIAVGATRDADCLRLGLAATSRIDKASIRVSTSAGHGVDWTGDVSPSTPLVVPMTVPAGVDLRIEVTDATGEVLLAADAVRAKPRPVPPPAAAPADPAAMETIEALYLAGLHLEQYRHATRLPEAYWHEALRRDPGDARVNVALGSRLLREGLYGDAEQHLRRAVARLTANNANPYDGEAHYQLGLCLQLAGRPHDAEDAYAKAAWNRPWQGAAHYALAQIQSSRGDRDGAIRSLEAALDAEPRHASARALLAALLRRMGMADAARAAVAIGLAADPLDRWMLAEQARLAPPDGADAPADNDEPEGPGVVLSSPQLQVALDVAHDYAAAGLLDEAIETLADLPSEAPMRHYTLGWLHDRLGDEEGASRAFARGRAASPDGCFPARLVEIEILSRVREVCPGDARAPYYLGNLYYDRRRYAEAIRCWEAARRLDPTFATVHRNLGIAEANVRRRPAAARRSYLRAFAADPSDGRVLYELDQLLERQGVAPESRLARLRAHKPLVDRRDDLGVAYAALLDQVGESPRALAYIVGRRFHPWEGGEGLALGAHDAVRLSLARAAMDEGDPQSAVEHLRAALEPPASLGEARHPLAPEHELWFELGRALALAGDPAASTGAWRRAAEAPAGEAARSAASYFRGLALRALGDGEGAASVFRTLLRDARRQARARVAIDYFATSLPALLLFEDDLDRRNRLDCGVVEGLALLGLGRRRAAKAAFEAVLALDPNRRDAQLALRWARAEAAQSVRAANA